MEPKDIAIFLRTMVRNYSRTYRNCRRGKQFLPYTSYTQQALDNALADVAAGMSLGEAGDKHKIPKSTLSRKYRGLNNTQDKAGHPTLFTPTEEKAFIQYMKVLGDWGFPFDTLDLRIFAQKYLNKLGKTVYSLKDNMPGYEWAKNFLLRHKNEISNRFATNISTDRAKVTPQLIDSFFENFEKTIDGVSPDCIINYDETNLTDDPGNKKYIYKRGSKYPERVINNSKTAVSIMFSGTADGTLLPVYVVYKAEHLWDSWLEGGPDNCRYNRSKSGWFDGTCFEDYFQKVIVPYAMKKKGRKVIIGDNLSSHFSESVLETCEKYDISFVCLPPKSTHILQPLDVAFYAPLKHYWRQILTDWKKQEGRKHKTLIKTEFPRLLKQLMNKLAENSVGSTNLKAGFEKCGLYPVNSSRPKSRLPQNVAYESDINTTTSEVIVNMLQEIRGVTAPTENRRRKKCNVEPGKSITVNDIMRKEQASKREQVNNEELDSDVTIVLNEIEEDRSSLDSLRITNFTEMPQTSVEPRPGPSTSKEKKPKKKTKMPKLMSDRRSKTKTQKTNNRKQNRKRTVSQIEAEIDREILQAFWEESNINQPKKKKAGYLSQRKDSTTSVSDIMSIHSDSDVLDALSDITNEIISPHSPVEKSPQIIGKGKGRGKKTTQKAFTKTNNQNLDISSEPKIADDDPIKTKSQCEQIDETSVQDIINPLSPSITDAEPMQIVTTPETTVQNIIHEDGCTSILITASKNICEPTAQSVALPETTVQNIIHEDDCTSTLITASKNICEPTAQSVEMPETTVENIIHEDDCTFTLITASVNICEPSAQCVAMPTMDDDVCLKSTTLKKADSVTNECSADSDISEQDNSVSDLYSVNEKVLVRYYQRKKWIYYIGTVEDVKLNKYSINFFRTIKKPELKFIIPKKNDRDIVPIDSLVKRIDLDQNYQLPNTFKLRNSSDNVYFE